MPTFENALIIIKSVSETQHVGADDFFQDCCVAVLENGDFSEKAVKAICQAILKKRINEKISEKYRRHKPIYNDDGECLDDNLVFTENPWEEENVGSRVSDEVKEKVKTLAKLVETTALLGKAAYHKNCFESKQYNRKKTKKKTDLSILCDIMRNYQQRPNEFRNQKASQWKDLELFYLKKGKKNGKNDGIEQFTFQTD